MENALRSWLTEQLGDILQLNTVSGGDIARAYQIHTDSRTFFLKIMDGPTGFAALRAETNGLREIASREIIQTPSIQLFEQLPEGQAAVLVMDFIPTKPPNKEDFKRLGAQLAQLHATANQTAFGWHEDNFIGRLPQQNGLMDRWDEFYVARRLEPQLRMARDKNLLETRNIPSVSRLQKSCKQLMTDVKPALLHGDLWGGNFLITTDGTPVLIDPAVYVGDAEVDLAMTRLFGGFGPDFYDAYAAYNPPREGRRARQDVYQLYYLLVHLNLFGASYRQSVLTIMKRYFG